MSLQARDDVGVRTPLSAPSPKSVPTPCSSRLTTSRARRSSHLDDGAVDDTLLRAIWATARHPPRTASRTATSAAFNIVVDETGAPWLVDFGFSEVAVPDARLDADIAQMLAAVAFSAASIARSTPRSQPSASNPCAPSLPCSSSTLSAGRHARRCSTRRG